MRAAALKGSSEGGGGELRPGGDKQQAAARQPAGRLIESLIKSLDGC